MLEKAANEMTLKNVLIFLGAAWICSCFPLLFIKQLGYMNWYQEYASFIYELIPSVQIIAEYSENPFFAKMYLAFMWTITPLLSIGIGYASKDTWKRRRFTHIFIWFMIFFSAYAAVYWKILGIVLPLRVSEQIILYGGGLRIVFTIGAGFLFLSSYFKLIKNNYLLRLKTRKNNR